jgi:Zinc carboxypeptidase/Immune inhibitor A-like, MAM domain
MRGRLLSVGLGVLTGLVVAPSALAASPLNAYRVNATAENRQALSQAGFDMTEADKGGHLEIVAREGEVAALGRKGVEAKRLTRISELAAPGDYTGSDAGFDVWTRYDAVPDDGKEQYVEQYRRIAGANSTAKLVALTPQTHLGRTIYAVKITKNAKLTPDGTRPAVLYNAQQHAREWLAGETCRRTLDFFVDNYGRTGAARDSHGNPIEGIRAEYVTQMVNTRELWFMCISNPDGYEYTFTEGNRLWRKNMADNDRDGTFGEPGDGVDPNRNYATNFRRDEEGASDNPASETYRGVAGDSEPETKAMKSLWARVPFVFLKNDHTAAELLLYPQGFQQYTPTPDNGLFEALAGDDADPAIADKVWNPATGKWDITGNRFDPDLSSELYITNGDELDDAYHSFGILGFTPEGTDPGIPGLSGFEFPDDEDQIEGEFRRHLLFALDLADSAAHPDTPASHLGNTVQDFYVKTFDDSYGDPQPVEASVKRSLSDVRMRYRINDGKVQQVSVTEAPGGERFNNDPGVRFHRVRGVVSGTQPDDKVEVWFEGGGKSSSHFTYTARKESGAKVLIMSAENYSAGAPVYADTTKPSYLSYYTQTLDALGVKYDVYDVDAMGNRSPDFLGVLGHYDAVIWYTGDDLLTRQKGQPGGTSTARLATEEMIDARAYLNEGGKLVYTGKNAGVQYGNTSNNNQQFRNFGFPEPWESPDGKWCTTADTDEFNPDNPAAADGCILQNNDFLQYYLGAYIKATPGQSFDDAAGHPFALAGTGPFEGATWMFDGTGAGNQGDHTSSTFVVTSSILPPEEFPLYASSQKAADWLRDGAAPFSPFSGTQYMAAGADSRGYKRLTKTVSVPSDAAAPQLTFKFSADLEQDWDFFAVEARTPGGDDWTTLPDLDTDGAGPDSVLTTADTGDSCTEGLATDADAPHPFLQTYWNADCTPKDGKWSAFTGSTGGWTDFTVDLSAYKGQDVELSLTVITDWGTLGLGTWVDDAKLVDGSTVLESTDFEADQGGWDVTPPPPGSDELARNWTRRGQEFEEGGVVTTDDTVYTGFGFEGLSTESRSDFMERALQHLGVIEG